MPTISDFSHKLKIAERDLLIVIVSLAQFARGLSDYEGHWSHVSVLKALTKILRGIRR
jgi:hypothetical protein